MKQSRASTLLLTLPRRSTLKPTIPTVGHGKPLSSKSEGDIRVQNSLSLLSTARRVFSKVPSRGMVGHSYLHLAAHGHISTTIKRIVILSSTAAISNAPNPGKVYTEEDWNDAAINAVKKDGKAAAGNEKYSASKTLAEKGKQNERGH